MAVWPWVEKEFPETEYCRKDWVKSKDNVGTMSTAGWHPDRPGRVDAFCGLAATFYRLKTKKILAGRVALGDWLGCYRVSTKVGIFA